jgi:hypothetical protein
MKMIPVLTLVFLTIAGSASAPMASANSQQIPPDGTVLIFGKKKSMHECRTGRIGTTIQLQVMNAGRWKTVSTARLRKNLALCPKQIARFDWLVDALGTSTGAECGVPTFVVQLKTVSTSTKQTGNVWAMKQYSSESDYFRMMKGALDKLFLGKCD